MLLCPDDEFFVDFAAIFRFRAGCRRLRVLAVEFAGEHLHVPVYLLVGNPRLDLCRLDVGMAQHL